MSIRRLLTYVLLAAPVLSGADKPADKTLEILREVGDLQDQLKAFQKSLTARLMDLDQANAEHARAAAAQAEKAVGAISDRVAKGFQDQQDQQGKTLAEVAAVGSQLHSVAGDLDTMRQAMNDLTASVSKLATQVNDLTTAVKALQAAAPAVTATQAPQISASDLWSTAETDRLGGKFELALQEYTEFVARFGDSPQAPDAQYYIGSVHYSNREWDDAVKAFDQLLQAHPDTKRAAEALYYKGDSLARSGHWPEADTTLKELRKRFPTSPLAKQSLAIKPPAVR